MPEAVGQDVLAGSPIEVRLPDGKALSVPRGSTLAEVAARIGRRLAADAIAAQIDGRLVDLSARLDADCAVQILTPT